MSLVVIRNNKIMNHKTASATRRSRLSGTWVKAIPLEQLDDQWDNIAATCGVYIIRRKKPVARLGGVDKFGILYVGKARNIRERLWQFWYADHAAGWYLWRETPLARLVLSPRIRTVADTEQHLGKLSAVVAAPIHEDLIGRAERAVLWAYIARFGEAPPLNFSLPKKWDEAPPAEDVRWADVGLLHCG